MGNLHGLGKRHRVFLPQLLSSRSLRPTAAGHFHLDILLGAQVENVQIKFITCIPQNSHCSYLSFLSEGQYHFLASWVLNLCPLLLSLPHFSRSICSQSFGSTSPPAPHTCPHSPTAMVPTSCLASHCPASVIVNLPQAHTSCLVSEPFRYPFNIYQVKHQPLNLGPVLSHQRSLRLFTIPQQCLMHSCLLCILQPSYLECPLPTSPNYYLRHKALPDPLLPGLDRSVH